MGYFSGNIPKDNKEAEDKAKKFKSILEKGIKKPKGKIVSSFKYKGSAIKKTLDKNK